MISKLKQAVLVALMALSFSTVAKAQETEKPVKLETRVAFETDQSTVSQGILTYDKNELFVETSEHNLNIGTELQHDKYKINIGYRHTDEEDTGRALLTKRDDQGFIGLEWQNLDEDVYGIISGVSITANSNLESTVDTAGNVRAALFSSMSGGRWSLGGGGQQDDHWEVNLGHSGTLSDALNSFVYMRFGNDNMRDIRLELGRTLAPNQTDYVFSVTGSGFNETSQVGDVTFPFTVGKFPLLSAESFTGSSTGDIGIDARYRGNNAYLNTAINAGDLDWCSDIMLSAKGNRNLETDQNSYTVGVSSKIAGIKVWYEADFDEDLDNTGSALYIGGGISW